MEMADRKTTRRRSTTGMNTASSINTLKDSEPSSWMSRTVDSVFRFVKMAEFEILFILFFLIAFLIFKDLTSRPEYNQILVKKPGGSNLWPY